MNYIQNIQQFKYADYLECGMLSRDFLVLTNLFYHPPKMPDSFQYNGKVKDHFSFHFKKEHGFWSDDTHFLISLKKWHAECELPPYLIKEKLLTFAFNCESEDFYSQLKKVSPLFKDLKNVNNIESWDKEDLWQSETLLKPLKIIGKMYIEEILDEKCVTSELNASLTHSLMNENQSFNHVLESQQNILQFENLLLLRYATILVLNELRIKESIPEQEMNLTISYCEKQGFQVHIQDNMDLALKIQQILSNKKYHPVVEILKAKLNKVRTAEYLKSELFDDVSYWDLNYNDKNGIIKYEKMINDIDEQIDTGDDSLFSFVDLDKETWQLCLRYLFMKYKYLFSHTEYNSNDFLKMLFSFFFLDEEEHAKFENNDSLFIEYLSTQATHPFVILASQNFWFHFLIQPKEEDKIELNFVNLGLSDFADDLARNLFLLFSEWSTEDFPTPPFIN